MVHYGMQFALVAIGTGISISRYKYKNDADEAVSVCFLNFTSKKISRMVIQSNKFKVYTHIFMLKSIMDYLI